MSGTSWHAFFYYIVPSASQHVVAGLPYWKMEKVIAAYRSFYDLCESNAEDQRLARLISQYGKALEYDLAVRGIDLGVEWRGRRWRRLLNLIERLPRATAYGEAVSQDEVLARLVLSQPDQPESKTKARRSMSEWTPDVELLSMLVDRVSELIQTVAATGGAKPRRIEPAPRPVTAAERVRNRLRMEKHRSVVARMLPHKTR